MTKVFHVAFSQILIVLMCFSVNSIAADSHEYKKPEDVVAWLYRDFAWEAIMGHTYWKNGSLLNQPREILSLYFSDELVSLILKDRECVREKHELCNLDFNPIFVSQDPAATDLEISPADQSSTVHVQFIYPSNMKRIELDFKVERTTRGWRISDIVYKEFLPLRKILSMELNK
ncbi:MAG: hypothetical protein HY730_05435 [Candidatus Tectomicrobia bacterium]|uniref:DUF3828 domain-containing protein n=1 Tax=Tectimicrobiota bacterium TaxID=2528274 RepID=A0A933GKZ8_UNCTE|nr:hypothetical protein [Candidatus Tectomicrobia bacterium]